MTEQTDEVKMVAWGPTRGFLGFGSRGWGINVENAEGKLLMAARGGHGVGFDLSLSAYSSALMAVSVRYPNAKFILGKGKPPEVGGGT